MKLIVLSGPGGVGKSTVISYLRANESNVWVSVSATTRAPRVGEVDGIDYYFLSDSEFDKWISEDKTPSQIRSSNQSHRLPQREGL